MVIFYIIYQKFNIYCSYKFTKEIWENLKRKYSTKDAGIKKYVVGRFLDYMMSDDKPITEQDHEYQNIVLEIF